jgi:hypothetical protein
MTEKQYYLLLDLYHEYNDAFRSLPQSIQDAYYDILFGRAIFSN